MAITDKVFSGDTLRVGYRFQRHWDNSMAYAFFFAEVGGGLFFVSLLLNSVMGMVLGLIMVSTGKPYFHLAHMGVPTKAWRAMLRPDRSWISRGLLGLGAMIGTGVLYVIALSFGDQLGIAADSGLVWLLKVSSAVFCLVVMSYQGFAMSHSSAISIWNSAIMPMSSLLYSLTIGVAVAMVIVSDDQANSLAGTQLLLFMGLGIMHLMFLHGGWHGSPGAKTSVELLLQTLYTKWYLGLVIAIGIILPALLLWAMPGSKVVAIIAAASTLAGFLAWRILIFKIGVYEPIMSMNPFHTAN
ncbi:MAG: NrfD/PsrC family molybdoenzyme membrane anchor subunit [Halioglobus sp.]